MTTEAGSAAAAMSLGLATGHACVDRGNGREGARRAADDGERGFLLVVLVAGVAADDRR